MGGTKGSKYLLRRYQGTLWVCIYMNHLCFNGGLNPTIFSGSLLDDVPPDSGQRRPLANFDPWKPFFLLRYGFLTDERAEAINDTLKAIEPRGGSAFQRVHVPFSPNRCVKPKARSPSAALSRPFFFLVGRVPLLK